MPSSGNEIPEKCAWSNELTAEALFYSRKYLRVRLS